MTVCIVCDKDAHRKLGTDYYCKYHTPNDKRKKQELERKMRNERLKLMEASKGETWVIPNKNNRNFTEIKREVKD